MDNSVAGVDWGIVARIVHVLAVVVWIGGVWFVKAVILPVMRKKPPEQWLAEFNANERAPQARIAGSTCSTSTTSGTAFPMHAIGGCI